jgi:hypothetical protein
VPELWAELLREGVARATTRRFTGGREARVTRTRKWPSELNGAFGSTNAIAGADDCTTSVGSFTSTAPRQR